MHLIERGNLLDGMSYSEFLGIKNVLLRTHMNIWARKMRDTNRVVEVTCLRRSATMSEEHSIRDQGIYQESSCEMCI